MIPYDLFISCHLSVLGNHEVMLLVCENKSVRSTQEILHLYDLAGPVVMDLAGFTEQGFKRKLAVQTLFGKILYLSEVSC